MAKLLTFEEGVILSLYSNCVSRTLGEHVVSCYCYQYQLLFVIDYDKFFTFSFYAWIF